MTRSNADSRGTALPAPLLRFVELFNRGAFWESHEALEEAWRESGSSFYRGLILYASAFVHARRRNPHGLEAQLRKAERVLAPYAPAYLGLDVAALLAHGRRCRELVTGEQGVERRRAGAMREIPAPRLRPDPSLVRGDEAELGSLEGQSG